MRIFPITKRNEFKQTIAILDTFELRTLIAEAIAERLGVDLQDEKNSFYYTSLENLQHLSSTQFEAHAVAIHFIEKGNFEACLKDILMVISEKLHTNLDNVDDCVLHSVKNGKVVTIDFKGML